MTIDLPGHSSPSVGFEVPLEMLAACHGRVERQCATLRRLVPHLAAQGPDADARSAAAAVMRYFDTSARDHHADEEVDLFPALARAAACAADPAQAAALAELVASLIADHRVLEVRWHRVRLVLAQVAAGLPAVLEAGDVEALVTLYERHIEREEDELLTLAAQLLSADALDAVGRAMRERRGVAAPG